VTLTNTACTAAGGVWQAGVCGVVVCPVTTWIETGDAGDLPATAQAPTGGSALLKIRGTLTAAGDVDMYKLNICSAANWGATTVGGATFDTQFFLFKADGTGVAADDDSAATLQSTLSSLRVAPLGNGTYYLAISGFNNDPKGITTSGLIWTSNVQDAIPDGPAAAEAIGSWVGGGATGTYAISLTGTCFNVSCYANCDGSTSTPLLTANDFQCFLNEYAAGTSYANCDGSTAIPLLTANDFQCFLNAYAAGCT
jgi:hypothetical protein